MDIVTKNLPILVRASTTSWSLSRCTKVGLDLMFIEENKEIEERLIY